MKIKSKFVHKCRVTWCKKDKVWVVSDRTCGTFAENKNWKRAVYIGIYHFIFELEAGMSRTIIGHTLRLCPHGYEKGDHHWYRCMGVNPFNVNSLGN